MQKKILILAGFLVAGTVAALTAPQKSSLAQAYEKQLSEATDAISNAATVKAARESVVLKLKAPPQIRSRIALVTPMIWRNFHPDTAGGQALAQLLSQPPQLSPALRPPAPAKVNDVQALATQLLKNVSVKWNKTCRPEMVYLMYSNVVCGQLQSKDVEETYKSLLRQYTKVDAVYIRYDYGSYTLMLDLGPQNVLADINFLGETGEVMVTFEAASQKP